MFGQRLREVREKRQFSQQDLADQLGMSVQHISRLENGKYDNPKADTVILIAKVLDVSIDYLLGLTDDPGGSYEGTEISPDERKLLSAYRNGDLRQLMKVASEKG